MTRLKGAIGGRRSRQPRKITARSILTPPGPSIQMSLGECFICVQAKSIATDGTGYATGDWKCLAVAAQFPLHQIGHA